MNHEFTEACPPHASLCCCSREWCYKQGRLAERERCAKIAECCRTETNDSGACDYGCCGGFLRCRKLVDAKPS